LASGNKGRYAEHDQPCRQPRFFSHKETIRARKGHVNPDLANQNSSGFCLARPMDWIHGHFQPGTQIDDTKLAVQEISNFWAGGDIKRVLDLEVSQDFPYLS
jgi:hypothetical protein